MGRIANIKMCSPFPALLLFLIAAALYVENINIMEQHDRSLSHTYCTLCTVQICFVVLLPTTTARRRPMRFCSSPENCEPRGK